MNQPQTDFEINGTVISPGKCRRLELPVARLPTYTMMSLPVAIAHGLHPGPTLWLSAAIHGDEINGVEIIRQVFAQINPRQLRGTLIAVPIVNVFASLNNRATYPIAATSTARFRSRLEVP